MTTPYTQDFLTTLNKLVGERTNPPGTLTAEDITKVFSHCSASQIRVLRHLVRDCMQYRETLRAERERCQRIHTESTTMTPRLTTTASRLITLLQHECVSLDATEPHKQMLVQAVDDLQAELTNINATPAGKPTPARQPEHSEIIYLGAPYSHDNATVRAERCHIINRIAAGLMKQGYTVFSPITHGVALQPHLPAAVELDHEFRMLQCLPLLRASTRLVIAPLDGWMHSKDLKREIDEALAMGMPVGMLSDKEMAQHQ